MSDGIKQYLYISDRKVNNLFAQISPTTPVSSDEVKLGPSFLSLTMKGELEPEQKRMVKLDKVVDWITRYGNVGTLDEPSEYVRGRIEMRWGPFLDQGELGDSKAVWFGGATDRTVVGLAGSAHHVIGNIGQSEAWSRSVLPGLLPHLFKAIEKIPIHQLDREDWWIADQRQHAHQAVYIATTEMTGVQETVEFMAEKLLFGKSHLSRERLASNRNILLATPIYVAKVFDPYEPHPDGGSEWGS
jgi:hypothetical protein